MVDTKATAKSRSLGAVLGASLVLVLTGCGPTPSAVDPAELRVSAIPDQSPERVREQHRALVDRVCLLAKVPCRWVPAESYESLVDAIGRGEIDLAYFGGVTFAQAQHRHGVLPLAMRDIDTSFTSLVVVRRDDPVATLQQLAGRRFAFGARSSTSGHFMLRRRLVQAGVEPERDFASVTFSGNHDATLRAVAEGQVDAGGVNATVFYRRLLAGDAVALQLRVIWQSMPYADYVWAARAALSPDLRTRLTDAFLDLSPARPADAEALRAEGAAGYVPAYAEDFDEVLRVVQSQGGL